MEAAASTKKLEGEGSVKEAPMPFDPRWIEAKQKIHEAEAEYARTSTRAPAPRTIREPTPNAEPLCRQPRDTKILICLSFIRTAHRLQAKRYPAFTKCQQERLEARKGRISHDA